MNSLLRSFFSGLSFLTFGIGSVVLSFFVIPAVMLFAPKARKRKILAGAVRLSWILFVKLMTAFRLIDVRFFNYEELKQATGAVIVANHPSLLDIVILLAHTPNSVTVAKAGLLKNPLVRVIIQSVCLPNNMDAEKFLEEGGKLLNAGFNIIIFPSGTRTLEKVVTHRGFAYLALRNNRPILPVKIKMSQYILGKGQKWHDVGSECVKYDFFVSNPIYMADIQGDNERGKAKALKKRIKKFFFEDEN